MDETKITARLPNLDVEITRRELPEENAETITLRMTAVPSFEALANYMMRQGNVPFTALSTAWMSPWIDTWANPFLSWTRLGQAFWLPWLQPMTPRVPRQDKSDDG